MSFVTVPSEETTAKFQQILGDCGLEDRLQYAEVATTVDLLSKLGADHQACKSKVDSCSQKLSKLNLQLNGWEKTQKNRGARAKRKALDMLDDERQAQKMAKTHKRRRMIWSKTRAKASAKKKVKESFEGMSPMRIHKKKVTLEERLEAFGQNMFL